MTLLSELNQWTKVFLEEKKNTGRSVKTIEDYRRVLESFYEFCTQYEEEIEFKEINRLFLNQFISEQYGKLSNNSKFKNFSVLKGFLQYIAESGGTDITESFKKISIKQSKRIPNFLTDEELEKILKSLTQIESNTYLKVRKKLIFKLLIYTGIRASELINLSLKDFNLNEKNNLYVIRIKGKGDKERFVYVKEPHIYEEINFLRKNAISENLFIRNSGNKITRNELYLIISRHLKYCKISKVGVHLFRHSFGQYLRRKGTPIAVVSSLLGHSSVQITEKYFGRAKEDEMLKEIENHF